MDEARRKKFNAERILLVDVSIRPQVAAVITALERKGHAPIIGAEVWRNPATQLALYRKGLSKLTWGFHCATTPDGKPGSLACDLFDSKNVQRPAIKFTETLIASALEVGLGVGAFFGLDARQKEVLAAACKAGALTSAHKIGWDSPHVETRRVTVTEARKGKR